MAEPGWVLWSGTVGLESPVLPRLPAAVAAGCSYVSISPLDVQRADAAGLPASELRRHAEDAGLDLIIDPIMNWHAVREPSRSRFAGFGVDEVLRMAEDLHAVSMTAIAATTSASPDEELPELFGDLCDRAAAIGVRVHLEFIPMSVVRDLAMGWGIVAAADRPNGGLLFDTWHFFRSGSSFDLLADIPGERIYAVQVNDAAAEVRGTLRDDTLDRRLPGDGDFDLRRVLAVLARTGGLRMIGPEVFSPELEALPPAEAATLAVYRTRALLAEVLGVRP
jgi:sugar phosphate isomerase/epimerase